MKKELRIGIQCNGSISIGMGHIMRTMVLAEKLKEKCQIYYICKKKREYRTGVSLIQEKGYQVFYDEDHVEVDFLILDSYDVSKEMLSSLRTKFGKLMYIDDLNELDYYDCDILLNRNLGAEKLKYNVPKECKLLLGTNYSLLRDEFRQCTLPKIKNEVNKILITMGGTDPHSTSVKVLDMIKNLAYSFIVVVGNGYSEKTIEKLRKIANNNSNLELHFNPRMTDLMCQCDMAITACGGTIQELAALGIPQLAISIAPNQESVQNQNNRFYLYAGNEKDLEKESFLNLLNYMINNPEIRYRLSESGKSLINRNGVDLVIKVIKEELGLV